MELEKLDTEVTNLRQEAGIVDTQHFKTEEPVLMVMGKLANGIDVTVESQYFAAMKVGRELDEEEQAVHNEKELEFSSVLIADEDGMVAQESVVNVEDGEIDHALDAFEMALNDGEILLYETQSHPYQLEDGTVVEPETPDIEELTE